MIKLRDGKICWEAEDQRIMAKIIGSENAIVKTKERYRCAPPLGSMMRLISRKGLLMSKSARMELAVLEEQRKQARKLKKLKDEFLADPLATKFFPHQRADLFFMRAMQRPSYLIAHEPGVGKTLDAIRMAEWWKAERIAVICTNNAKEQWYDEIGRWRDRKLKRRILDGSVREQVHAISTLKKGWMIGHWESLVWAREGWLSDPWDLVILDEAHHIQNRNAQRTDTVFDMEKTYALALSGHPFANRLNELWPILRFLYPGLYPSFWRWAHLQIQIDEGMWGGLDLRTPRRPKLLKWELETFTLRRRWKEVRPDLPPITRRKQMVYLSTKARAEYDKLRKQFFVELEAHKGEKNILAIPSMLARITRMRQYLIDPGILGAKEPSAKYAAVHQLLIDAERPSVIFTAYRQSALRLHAYLRKKKWRVAYIVGGMSKKTNKIKKKFLRGKLDAVIIMISVGGTSLNFGKYGYVIGLDFPWNAKDLEQPEGRVHRPEEGTGKMVPTVADWLCVKDSYEERMMQRILDKRTDFAKVFTVSGAKELFK